MKKMGRYLYSLVILFSFCGLSYAKDAKHYLLYVGTYTDGQSKGIYAYRFDSDVGKLEPVGLALTVPVLIIITSLAGDEFRWRGVLISAVVLTLFSWLIFVYGLKLTIPMWPSFIGA